MEQQIITIEQVTEVSQEVSKTIRSLAKQLGNNYKQLTDDDIKEMVTSPNIFLLAAREEGNMVGMITLIVYRIPYTKKAYIDDLVIDESQRGKGLGTRLMEKAIQLAREKGAHYVDLTASPHRAAGNKLYEKMGFQKRDTNVYRLTFDYGKV